jgi:hypothetical protein
MKVSGGVFLMNSEIEINIHMILGMITIIAFGLVGFLLLFVSSPITMFDLLIDVIVILGIGFLLGLYFFIQRNHKADSLSTSL